MSGKHRLVKTTSLEHSFPISLNNNNKIKNFFRIVNVKLRWGISYSLGYKTKGTVDEETVDLSPGPWLIKCTVLLQRFDMAVLLISTSQYPGTLLCLCLLVRIPSLSSHIPFQALPLLPVAAKIPCCLEPPRNAKTPRLGNFPVASSVNSGGVQ